LLFRKESTHGRPQLKTADIEKKLLYKDVCVVFLKERVGLVVFWKGDQSMQRFFSVLQ
jgi:hypothetical protein